MGGRRDFRAEMSGVVRGRRVVGAGWDREPIVLSLVVLYSVRCFVGYLTLLLRIQQAARMNVCSYM